MLKFQFISAFIILTYSTQVWTSESFNDFPLVLDHGDYMIQATLTDQDSGEKYHIQEYLHSYENKRGKISISSSIGNVNLSVHYHTGYNDRRLVVQGYNCDLFNYGWKWDKRIKGVSKPLLNHILLVGPSLIYRLKQRALWRKTDQKTRVRGAIMKSSYITIDNKLNVTFYYKSDLDAENGLSRPSRIIFAGHDPTDYSWPLNQNLILDIYQITATHDLGKLVGPQPGIGCPLYFVAYESHIETAQDSVHFISIENVIGSQTNTLTRNEVYADEQQQLLSVKTTTSQGKTTESIYDYRLAIIYKLTDHGGYSVSPMDRDTIGISLEPFVTNFAISHLLETSSTTHYLGENWFENRPGLSTDAWESVDYNVKIPSGWYDKVVKTIYKIEPKNANTRSGVIPIGLTINAYNKSSSGTYELMESTRKNFYDFGEKISSEQYSDRFEISDYFPNPSDRKTLAIRFDCTDENCVKFSHKYHHYGFRERIRKVIVSNTKISPSRLGKTDIVQDGNSLIAYITFLKFPGLPVAFKSSYIHLSTDTLKYGSVASGSIECLKQKAHIGTSYEAIVYCTQDRSCFHIEKISDLVDQKAGQLCQVFDIPFKNLRYYVEQTPLEMISSEILRNRLTFSFMDEHQSIKYQVSRVDEVIVPESKSHSLFIVESSMSKFIEDGADIIGVKSANNLADCYRSCAHFDNDKCESFSFCQLTGKIECLLSTLIYSNTTDRRTSDTKCTIYRKNHLLDYMEISNRKYKSPISIAMDNRLDDCADKCANSDECFSFEHCQGVCRFGGYYTDSASEYSEDCNIYMPKVVQKYSRTGKLVTETYHTELNITLDQCAALCYDVSSTRDDSCVSFNYCPRGLTESSCNLSKYSVNDSSAVKNGSNVCTNYELNGKTKSREGTTKGDNSQRKVMKGTSEGSTFAIVMLAIVVGLSLGSIVPLAYRKKKTFVPMSNLSSPENNSFNWSRQTDDETLAI